MSKRSSIGLVLAILACLAAYLVGNGRAGLWDRDEPWYAQCSREMRQTGDWVVPTFLGKLRTEKPPLVYWGHLASMRFFGDNEFAVRFLSTTAMTLTLIVIGIVMARSLGADRAAWTVFILGTSGLIIAAAKMCLTDAVLLLWISIAQFCLYAIYRGKGSWPVVLLMWVALALGGMTKGPIALVAPAMTAIVLLFFEFRRLLPALTPWRASFWNGAAVVLVALLAGLAIIILIDGPWLYFVNKRAPEWLPTTLDIAGRHVKTSMEGHSGFPGYYLALAWGTFFPWSLLLPTAVAMAWRNRKLPEIRFAAAAVIGPWFFQEFLFKTKLPHYVLPAYPAMAFLTADALVRCIRGEYPDLIKPVFVRIVGIWAAVVGIVASITWLAWPQLKFFGLSVGAGIHLRDLPWGAMIVLSILGYVYTLSVWWFFRRRQVAAAGVAMGLGMVALVAVLYGWYLPKANFLRLSIQAADVLKKEGAVHRGDVLMIDYREPSLAYYQGGTIREAPEDYLQNSSPLLWPRWLVLSTEAWNRLPAEKQALYSQVDCFRGWNYTGDILNAERQHVSLIDLKVVRRNDQPAVEAQATTQPAAHEEGK